MSDARDAEPESPQLVCLRYADGSVSEPLPVLYRGVDEDGLDEWEVMRPDGRVPVGILVGMLPGHSSIILARW